MNKLREICQEKLSNPAQDIEASNRMWNRRAKEVSRLSARADGDGYFSFFKSSVGDLDGMRSHNENNMVETIKELCSRRLPDYQRY